MAVVTMPPRNSKFYKEDKREKRESIVETSKKTQVEKSAIENVKDYVVKDVVIPSLKDLTHKAVIGTLEVISDIAIGAVEIKLYGERRKGKTNGGTKKYVSFDKYYTSSSSNNRSDRSCKNRSKNNFDDVVFKTRGDAEHVLYRMGDIIDEDGSVSVAEFYDLCGQSGEYTDNDWGWTSLKKAYVFRLDEDEYIINFPDPKMLNKEY